MKDATLAFCRRYFENRMLVSKILCPGARHKKTNNEQMEDQVECFMQTCVCCQHVLDCKAMR